jgi:hypothetical protein
MNPKQRHLLLINYPDRIKFRIPDLSGGADSNFLMTALKFSSNNLFISEIFRQISHQRNFSINGCLRKGVVTIGF